MCLCKKLSEMTKPKTPPRSPYRRHLQLLKPKLSRRIVPSARVNLNMYWSKFEDLSKQNASIVSADLPYTAELLRTSMFSAYNDNEINENLVNELMELASK